MLAPRRAAASRKTPREKKLAPHTHVHITCITNPQFHDVSELGSSRLRPLADRLFPRVGPPPSAARSPAVEVRRSLPLPGPSWRKPAIVPKRKEPLPTAAISVWGNYTFVVRLTHLFLFLRGKIFPFSIFLFFFT